LFWGESNKISKGFKSMIKKIKEAYEKYKVYIRVDAVMYLVLILLIIGYFIVSSLTQ